MQRKSDINVVIFYASMLADFAEAFFFFFFLVLRMIMALQFKKNYSVTQVTRGTSNLSSLSSIHENLSFKI